MEWVETTGVTVDAAKDLALDRLGVDEADAEFEVLEEPTSKLLGLKKTDARVRARVRPVPQRAKQDRRSNNKRNNRRGNNKKNGRNREGAKNEANNGSGGGRQKQSNKGGDAKKSGGTTGGRTKGQKADKGGDKPAKQSEKKPSTNSEEKPVDDLSVTEQAEAVESFVRGILGAMGTSGETSLVEVDESTMEVHVTGDQLGLLIGPGGRTLSALNELSRTVVQRQAAGARVDGRVFVDVAGYREKRRTALAAFVRQEVQKVLDDGVDVALEPMSSADRKTVHDTVAEIDGVNSLSEGEDPRRRVVIVRA